MSGWTRSDEAREIEDLLQRIEAQMQKLETTEELARKAGQTARQEHAHLARDCLQWACAYINHGRFEEAAGALKAAKGHMGALI